MKSPSKKNGTIAAVLLSTVFTAYSFSMAPSPTATPSANDTIKPGKKTDLSKVSYGTRSVNDSSNDTSGTGGGPIGTAEQDLKLNNTNTMKQHNATTVSSVRRPVSDTTNDGSGTGTGGPKTKAIRPIKGEKSVKDSTNDTSGTGTGGPKRLPKKSKTIQQTP